MIRTLVTGGDPLRRGRDTGRVWGRDMRASVGRLPRFYAGQRLRLSALVSEGLAYLPAVRRHAPELLQELRAFARTADIPFEVAFFLFVEEEVVDARTHADRCTTAAFRDPGGHTFVLHNEDYAADFGRSLLLRVVDDGRCAIAQFQYLSGFPLATVFVNARGFAYGEDSMYAGIRADGVPKGVLTWKIRQARSAAEAVVVLRRYRSAAAFSLVTATREERAVIEVMPAGVRVRTFPDTAAVVHANHPVLFPERAAPGSASSRKRFRNVRAAIRRDATMDGMLSAMADPRRGIRRPHATGHAETTVATVTADLTAGTLGVLGWQGRRPATAVVRLPVR